MEYILYCDESIQNGSLYSGFFGGCLVSSKHLPLVENALNAKKSELNLYKEVKWTKVTSNYLNKYAELTTSFFSFVKNGMVKVRIVFSDNNDSPPDTSWIRERRFPKLYYEFIENAFAFEHMPKSDKPTNLRIYLDELPDTMKARKQFVHRLLQLPKCPKYSGAPIVIWPDSIAEVRSHDHVLLQCVDIVLGAVSARLNNTFDSGVAEGLKRSIAKEQLYNHIYQKICEIYPNFIIAESTELNDRSDNWTLPYRHIKRH